jgi:hypothetical protein
LEDLPKELTMKYTHLKIVLFGLGGVAYIFNPSFSGISPSETIPGKNLKTLSKK